MVDQPVGLAGPVATEIDQGRLVDQLRSVIDPELGVGIVDLGLIYETSMIDGVVHILMTTTTPACPLGPYLADAIRHALSKLESVLDVEIEVTYDPLWSPTMMSDEAKDQLGWPR